MKKTFKLILLPTREPSRLYGDNSLTLSSVSLPNIGEHEGNKHLYIIADENINSKGKCNALCLDELDHPEDALVSHVGDCNGCREIVATTNRSFDDLPSIPDAFIWTFVKAYNNKKPLTTVDLQMTTGGHSVVHMAIKAGSYKPLVNPENNQIIIAENKVYTKGDILNILKENGYEDDAIYDLFDTKL